jgi:hypothetical protein
LSKRQQAAPSRYDPSAPRQSKREQVRKQKQRRSMLWNILILGTLGAFLLGAAAFFVSTQRPGTLPGEQAIPIQGQAEVPAGTEIEYSNHPPSSGNHYAQAAPWGLSPEPVAEGTFVSNLARGGVVFLYECPNDDCAALEQQFEDLLGQAPPDDQFNRVKILAAPYDGDLPAPIVALAWGHQLNLESFDRATLLRWYDRFVNRGPKNSA